MSALERVLFAQCGATPEQRWAAGMLASALDQAGRGDAVALQWLERIAPRYVEVVAGDYEPDMVHAALLRFVDERAGGRSRPGYQPEVALMENG